MNLTINKLPEDELKEVHFPEAQAPDTPAEIGAVVANANLFAVEEADDAQSLDDISEEGDARFIPFNLTKRSGAKLRVYIRELDVLSVLDIEAGKLLVKSQQIVRAPAREAKTGLGLEIAACVYKRTKTGEYEPFFSSGKHAQEWMQKSQNKTLVAQAMAAIHLVNPEMSPQKKIQEAMKAAAVASQT